MAKALEVLLTYYEDRAKAARQCKGKGGRVVGYTCPYIPTEIIHAAGLLPVRIVGNPYIEPTIVDRFLEEFNSPWVRSAYDTLLKKEYDYLDGWVMSASNDSIIRLHYTFLGFPETCPRNYFWLDIPRRAGPRNYKFLVEELQQFKESLERTYDVEITDEKLSQSIKLYEENRQLLMQVSKARKEHSPRITGREAFAVMMAGCWISPEEHGRLLKQYLSEMAECHERADDVRIFLSGSPMHTLDLAEAIERTGATIVGDDLDTGDRLAERQIIDDPLMNPIERIADSIMWRFCDPRVYPTVLWRDHFEAKVRESRPDGIMFNFLKWEDIYGFHYPHLKERADKMDISHMLFEMQEYRLAAPERLGIRIEAFVEILRQRRLPSTPART